MENGNITSTNPYNFTFNLPQNYHYMADPFTNGQYDAYAYERFLLPFLIFNSLKNVNLVLMNDLELDKRLVNIGVNLSEADAVTKFDGILYGILDSSVTFYYLYYHTPWDFHVSPFVYHDSYVIYSSVKTERDETEVLSIQGLGKLVWVLVGLSLLAVSAVSSYIGNRKKMRGESHFTSFAESLWIHAADIVTNSVACAKNLAAPLRYTRAWWLLGVTIIIQFWCAGLKSDLLVDESFTIDSLEDLMSNPNINCYLPEGSPISELLEGEDSKYTKLRQQLGRKEDALGRLDTKENEEFVSGNAVVIDETTYHLVPALLEKLKRNKRKLYVGKTNYEECFTHMLFNKRLPRAIKERIDYVATRITETRQLEPHNRRAEFYKRGNVFESDESMSFTPMDIAYLTVVLRLWIIGLSLATATLFFECLGHERWRKRFFWTIHKIFRKIAATVEPYFM